MTEFQNQYCDEVPIRTTWDNLNPLIITDYDMDTDDWGNTYIVVTTTDDYVNPTVSYFYYSKISHDGTILDSRRKTADANHYLSEVDVFSDWYGIIHLAILSKDLVGQNGDQIYYYRCWYDAFGNLNGWNNYERLYQYMNYKELNIVFCDMKSWICVLGKEPGGKWEICVFDNYAGYTLYRYASETESIEELDAEIRQDPAPYLVMAYTVGNDAKWITFDTSAKQYSEPVTFISIPPDIICNIDLATDYYTGDSYIVYTKSSGDPGYAHEIYITTLDEDGASSGEDKFVGDYDGGVTKESYPNIAVDGLGRGHVWWREEYETTQYLLEYGIVTRLGDNYLVDKKSDASPGGLVYSLKFDRDMTPPGESKLFPIVRCFITRNDMMARSDDNDIRVLYYDSTTDSLVYRVSKSMWQSQVPIVNSETDETGPDIAYDRDGNIHMMWKHGSFNVRYNSWDEDNVKRTANDINTELDHPELGSLCQYNPEICIRERDTEQDTEVLCMFIELQNGQEIIVMVKLKWNAQGVDPNSIVRYNLVADDNIEMFEAVYDPILDYVHIVYQTWTSTNEDIKHMVVSPANSATIRNPYKIDGDKLKARNPDISLDPYSFPYIVYDDCDHVFLVHLEYNWNNPNQATPVYDSQQLFDEKAYNPRICAEKDIEVNGDVNIRDESDYDFGTHPNMKPNVNWKDRNDRYIHVVARRYSNAAVGTVSILNYCKVRMNEDPEVVLEMALYSPGQDPMPGGAHSIIDMVIDSRNRLYIAHWELVWDPMTMEDTHHILFQEVTNNGLMFVREFILDQSPEGAYDNLMQVAMDLLRYKDQNGLHNEVSVVYVGNLVSDNDYDIYLRRSLVYDEFSTNGNV